MRSDELDARSDVYSLDSRVTGTTSWDRHMRHCIRRVSELLAKTVAESLARRRLR